MIVPPRWSEEELDRERIRAQELFRQERMLEPLENYLEAFEEYQGIVEDLLETTTDLARLDEAAIQVLTEPELLEAFRYLAGPPISADDLKVLAEAVLSPSRLRGDVAMASRVVRVVRVGLDRRRFPWVSESREATESEREAAVLASAALMASARLSTSRRNEGKDRQEQLVENALLAINMTKAPTRRIATMNQAPRAGEFCRESQLGTRKADFVIGLYDQRIMAIECKVSNSSTNSVKRLNNDAAAKAEAWIDEFGRVNIVSSAVLSGVYKTHNLTNAQSRGLTLFWAHEIVRLTNWILATRNE
jgi:XamI-like restriction endonuclease